MEEAESLSGRSHSKSVPSGKLSTNFLAEQIASLTAAKCLTEADDRATHVVFLTDCKSVLGKKNVDAQDATAHYQCTGAKCQ